MYNLFDYLSWRGDLPLDAVPMSEADAVILSRLSYLPFDGVVSENMNESITVSQAADRIFSGEVPEFLWGGDDKLLRELAACERYRDLQLSGYRNDVDDERQMQFCALSVALGEQLHFLSYRGTDNTLTGWQEDFNLFFTFPLESHFEAAAYLDEAVKQFGCEFYLGGHSKGGNLAVYAASFCGEAVQEKIRAVYSLDGPGFEPGKLKGSGFEAIRDRIFTFVPQSSVFGMMFEHEEQYTIVKSNQLALWQHDVYSWEVRRDRLVPLQNQTGTSVFFDQTMTQFLDGLTSEEKKEFTEAVFEILKSTERLTFDEMLESLPRDIAVMMKSFTKLDSDTRGMIGARLFSFIKAAGGNLAVMNPLNKVNRRTRRELRGTKVRAKTKKRYKRTKRS